MHKKIKGQEKSQEKKRTISKDETMRCCSKWKSSKERGGKRRDNDRTICAWEAKK